MEGMSVVAGETPGDIAMSRKSGKPLMHMAPVAHDVVSNVDYSKPAKRYMCVSPEHCA